MKNIQVTCLSFMEDKIEVAVVESATGRVVYQEKLQLELGVCDHSGVIFQPELVSVQLKQLIYEKKLPLTTRVILPLKYLELKLLTLPIVPAAEMKLIIQAEAERESIFSFAEEPILVASEIIGEVKEQRQVLVATIPLKVIERLEETLRATPLRLVALEPSWKSLQRLLEFETELMEPCLIVAADEEQSELYIYDRPQLLFWRYLGTGTAKRESLNEEIAASLEHFRKRLELPQQIQKLIVCGNLPELEVETEYQWQRISLPQTNWLSGSGLAGEHCAEFDFRQGNSLEEGQKYLSYAPWISLGLLLLNLILGFYLWHERAENQRLQQNVIRLQRKFLAEKTRLNELRQLSDSRQKQLVSVQLSPLLSKLQYLLPDGLRFEKLTIDPQTQQMELIGISFSAANLENFLEKLTRVAKVNLFKNFETRRIVRNNLDCVDFRVKMLLVGIEDGR